MRWLLLMVKDGTTEGLLHIRVLRLGFLQDRSGVVGIISEPTSVYLWQLKIPSPVIYSRRAEENPLARKVSALDFEDTGHGI